MHKLFPYLIFNGNCREAMEFYEDVLDGEIIKMESFDEAPIETPKGAEERIFDAELIFSDLMLKASDSFPDEEVIIGENISLFFGFKDKNVQKQVYDRLKKDGEIRFELNKQSNFAMIKDKFGISWMLAYHPI